MEHSNTQRILFYEILDVKEEYIRDINRLIRQLTDSNKEFTAQALQQIVGSMASRLFLLSIGTETIGMCTLAIYNAPTGCKVWIEDVVVDKEHRGMGFGRTIMDSAIKVAQEYAPCTLMLTSRPARVAANAMYKATKFTPKETNVYTMKIVQQHPLGFRP